MLVRTKRTKVALFLKVLFLLCVTISYCATGGPMKVQGKTQYNNRDPYIKGGRSLLAQVENCTPAAINEFPSDGFTKEERQQGWIVLHISLTIYLFIFLAIACDDYFVPAIGKLCDYLHMREDVAGATFMAMASSSPEFFINCVGTFVTEGDIGVGAIVGSSVFNVLAVPACCGLFAHKVVKLDWWPLTRDGFMYGVSVVLLIIFLEDGKIYLYEALTLFVLYISYIAVMVFNESLMSLAHRAVNKCRRKGYYKEMLGETQPLILNGHQNVKEIFDTEVTLQDCVDLEESTKFWIWPSDHSSKGKLWWVFTWPICFILCVSTPDCRTYPRLYAVTFTMCVFWIGTASYIISWLITAVGDTLNIPDSVMGLTFLAAGMSVPEVVSSVLVTNQGHGEMGISSSIGSNTFDILLCLGLPWFIKTAFYSNNGPNNWVKINSSGLSYCAISLLSTLVILYLSIALNKFRLNWKVGLTCLVMYIAFLVFAALIELNVFFKVNLPICES